MIDDILTNYIHGDKFAELASPINRIVDNGIVPKGYGRNPGIIYCPTHYIDRAFRAIDGKRGPYLLITHNSDNCITKDKYDLKPKSIKSWWAQNVTIEREDLKPIPIGIERIGKGISGNINTIKSIRDSGIHKKSMLLNCYNINTNINERRDCFNYFRNQKFCVTVNNRIGFAENCQKTCECKFVVAPPGNGADCHRMWESLYLGSYPVVLKGRGLDRFKDLPFVYVDKWDDVTEELLNSLWVSMRAIKYDINLLRFSTWKNSIEITWEKIRHCKTLR